MNKVGPTIGLVCLAIALIIIAIIATVLSHKDDAQPQSRNRVPNMGFVSINGQDLADLKKQLQDTQAASQAAKDAQAKAEQAQHDIQAQLEQLSKDAKSGELGEGRPEVSAPGIISDFGSFKIESNTGTTESSDFYLAFTFTDRNGFTKRFFPVCPNQTVKTGVPVTLMYHWRTQRGTSEGERGCFSLDGFQTDGGVRP